MSIGTRTGDGAALLGHGPAFCRHTYVTPTGSRGATHHCTPRTGLVQYTRGGRVLVQDAWHSTRVVYHSERAELMDTPKAPRPLRYTSFHEEVTEVRAQPCVGASACVRLVRLNHLPYADAAAKLALQSRHPAGTAASFRRRLDVRGGAAARHERAAQGWRRHLEVSERSTARAVPVDKRAETAGDSHARPSRTLQAAPV